VRGEKGITNNSFDGGEMKEGKWLDDGLDGLAGLN
jgi:hypothetical protein